MSKALLRSACWRTIPHIALLTCMWKRRALTRFVFDWYEHLADSMGDVVRMTLHVAGSEGAVSRELAEGRGFHYVEVPNHPLGAKWNAGLASIRPHMPDAVLFIGSDDLLNRTVIEAYAQYLRRGARFLGVLDLYVFDHASRLFAYWPGYKGLHEGETAGLARLIHREYLDRVDWRLWRDKLENGLDHDMIETLAPVMGSADAVQRHHIFRSPANGFAPVDVKTHENLWSFRHLLHMTRLVPADIDAVLGRHYPAEWIDRLFALDPRGGG